jgi:hypothetical protein
LRQGPNTKIPCCKAAAPDVPRREPPRRTGGHFEIPFEQCDDERQSGPPMPHNEGAATWEAPSAPWTPAGAAHRAAHGSGVQNRSPRFAPGSTHAARPGPAAFLFAGVGNWTQPICCPASHFCGGLVLRAQTFGLRPFTSLSYWFVSLSGIGAVYERLGIGGTSRDRSKNRHFVSLVFLTVTVY